MPKIQALIEAEAQLAIAEAALEPLKKQKASLKLDLSRINNEIKNKLSGPLSVIEAAKKLQAVTLTSWHKETTSFTRYCLRESGSTDKCWDNRAWLRLIKHTTPYFPHDGSWYWTLRIYGANQIIIDPRQQGPTVSPNTTQMIEVADKILVEAGFVLTDIPPEF